ncbi:MAG: hypothetical protein R3C60_04800 [Parvularculaceae bacterium]
MKTIWGLSFLLVLAVSACGRTPPEPPAPYYTGGYELAPDSGIGGGLIICLRSGRHCDIRVPPSVVGLGQDADGEFLTAAVRPHLEPEEDSDPTDYDYYLIVRLFDSPSADGAACLAETAPRPRRRKGRKPRDRWFDCDDVLGRQNIEGRQSNCAVRGPYSDTEFEKIRSCHCVPAAYGSRRVKCIPGVDTWFAGAILPEDDVADAEEDES